MKEEWKETKEHYLVSNFGRVKNKYWKILKPIKKENGYYRVYLKSKWYPIHRLVAEAFIPNPDNKPQVNHIDGNKKNNNVNNLEWCTAGENIKHAYKTNLRSAKGENNTQAKLSEEQIKEIRFLYVKGKHCEFNSRGLAKKYNVNPKTILDIVNKKNWKDIIWKGFYVNVRKSFWK